MRLYWLFLLAAATALAEEPYFPNHAVRTQSGERLRFHQDLMAGKTVVFHSFFARCQGACPLLLGRMKALQESLGARLGREVVLISMTVDPANDTPETLADLAKTLGAKPGWHLLSGRKENLDWILYKLGQYVEKPEEHKTLFIIGNEASGKWTKLPASATAGQLEDAVTAVERKEPK